MRQPVSPLSPPRGPGRRGARVLAAALLGLAAAGAAQAEGVTFGGSESAANSSFSYLGLIEPLPGSRMGQGWYVRGMLSWLTYEYDTPLGGVSRRVKAQAPGVEVGVGYPLPLGGGWVLDPSLSVGLRDTRLTPADPGNDAAGTQGMLTPQLGLRGRIGGVLELDALAAHAFGADSNYARARLGLPLARQLTVGAEASLSEGARYHDRREGVFARLGSGRGSLTASAGYATDREGHRRSYFSLGGGFSF